MINHEDDIDPIEGLPKTQTHYTVHTDGSITDNTTGKTYEAGEPLLDVLTRSTLDERLPQKPAYSMPEPPLVIHYERPRIDWNTDRHPSDAQMILRKARQRYQ